MINRWVQKYVEEIEERLRWHWRRPQSTSCRVGDVRGEARIVERAFGIGPTALTKATALIALHFKQRAA